MEFYEKLSALMSLTAAKNIDLSKATGIDCAQLSKIKKGRRKMPRDRRRIRAMAEFFAPYFSDQYRRLVLYEFTSDPRLQCDISELALADVLFEWLTTSKKIMQTPAGRFLNSLESFPCEADISLESDAPSLEIKGEGVAHYYGNGGKRQAMRDLIAYLMAEDEPCEIMIATDESQHWILEDAAFLHELNAKIAQLAKKGYTFRRIQPPATGVDITFRAIERWMPAYMQGAVEQYYYPWTRDELHRRTLFVVPGKIALYARSFFGENESRITVLSTERMLVDVCCEEFNALAARCKPMMRIYSPDEPEELIACLNEISAMEADGVYKSGTLSVTTLPDEIIRRLGQRGGSAEMLSKSFLQRARLHREVLKRHTITELMYLPPLEEVFAGKVSVSGIAMFGLDKIYYTPAEYRLHLENILWKLETCPKYRVIFLKDPVLEHVTLYTKGDSRALIVKEARPYMLFSITEQHMASSLCDYLRHIAHAEQTEGSRRETVLRIRAEMNKLDEMLARV